MPCKACHFILMKNEDNFCEGRQIELGCDYCQTTWMAEFTSRVISDDLITQFLSLKDQQAQATAMFMLEFYTANIYHGNPKPINSENPKFKQYIGNNDTSLQVISLIGYTLVGSHFQPNGEMLLGVRIQLLLQEISLIRYTKSQGLILITLTFSNP